MNKKIGKHFGLFSKSKEQKEFKEVHIVLTTQICYCSEKNVYMFSSKCTSSLKQIWPPDWSDHYVAILRFWPIKSALQENWNIYCKWFKSKCDTWKLCFVNVPLCR